MTESSFEDIPGTTLFDGRMSRIGYHLNMFCMSLIKVENRAAFKADEASYLDRFSLTADQRRAVLESDAGGANRQHHRRTDRRPQKSGLSPLHWSVSG